MLTISLAEPIDVPAIAEIMDELDRFYGAAEIDPVEQRASQIEEVLFGEPPAAYVLLAKEATSLVGFAAYSFLWPAAGITRSLFLKELYVRRVLKRQGIGAALMRTVCDVAVKYGCSRVEWQTETANLDAQRFYAALGAQLHEGKVCYRLEGADIRRVATADEGAVRSGR